MKTFDWWSFAVGIAAILVGFLLGGFFLARVVHECCHAIACLLFGIPYSMLSWSQVVYLGSPNIFVNLAGGMGQALFSLLFFWLVTTLQKRILDETKLPIRIMLFIFELAFLTIAFHGVINGIWEGFFYQSYKQIHGNDIVWGPIILLCFVISFYILYKRRSRSLKSKMKENV